MMEDNEFEFAYCPECGSMDLAWNYVIAIAGKMRRCKSCGKEWHVIFENPKDFEEEDD